MRITPAILVVMAPLLALACGDASSTTADPSVTPPSSGPVAKDGGTAATPEAGAAATPDATAPASCARADVAKSARASLFDAFQSDLASLAGAARAARVDKLLADVAADGGTPLEDPATGRVVFLARGTPGGAGGGWRASGSFSGWSESGGVALAPIEGTDLWAGETNVAGSFEYKLLRGGVFVEDPLARTVVWDGIDRGFGVRGELNGIGHPGALPPDRSRMVALGKVHAQKLDDDRDVWVYFPAAYDDASCKKLPSIVFHDGLESLTRGAFAKKADELYASRPDLAAVLVFVGLPSQDVRMAQYTIASDGAKGAEYVDFLVDDLWPLVTSRARLCSKPAARGISGASLGGLISTYGAFEHPDRFGWIGAQSASFFWDDKVMITRVANVPKQPLRVYLDSGCPNDNCVVTDELAAVLATKGYDHVRIKQDGATHDWSFWRDRLPGMLTHFRDGQTACD